MMMHIDDVLLDYVLLKRCGRRRLVVIFQLVVVRTFFANEGAQKQGSLSTFHTSQLCCSKANEIIMQIEISSSQQQQQRWAVGCWQIQSLAWFSSHHLQASLCVLREKKALAFAMGNGFDLSFFIWFSTRNSFLLISQISRLHSTITIPRVELQLNFEEVNCSISS